MNNNQRADTMLSAIAILALLFGASAYWVRSIDPEYFCAPATLVGVYCFNAPAFGHAYCFTLLTARTCRSAMGVVMCGGFWFVVTLGFEISQHSESILYDYASVYRGTFDEMDVVLSGVGVALALASILLVTPKINRSAF